LLKAIYTPSKLHFLEVLTQMDQLNYKHLHYFWTVARCGGVARAGEKLHVTPQSISTQMRQLEAVIGNTLWQRAGRKLELTETGHTVLEYADRMFTVGEALKDALRGRPTSVRPTFRVGVTGSVVKVVAYRLIAPALKLQPAPRLQCREGRFAELLAQLAVHELDLVISDRAMPASMNVRGYNHLLADCGMTFLATAALARRLGRRFPQNLQGAPMLLPGGDSAVRPLLLRWLDESGLQPEFVGDFDDTAVMKAFGQAGAGVFAMPTMVAAETARQFGVVSLGSTNEVLQQVYAVSGERRLSNPAVLAISEAARTAVPAAAA
jgi:LysR family transcriptional activator of nhaA